MTPIHQTLILSIASVALASCATAPPPPPVPRVPAITLKPVADNNQAIKGQNAQIRQQNTNLQASVDAAIVAAHQAREEASKVTIDRDALQRRLDEVDKQQAAAKEQATAQANTIGKQAETIINQDALIGKKQDEADANKKLADKIANIADDRGVANAKYVQQEKDDNRWWGWHGVARSIGHALFRSAWHLLLWVGLPMIVIIGGLLLLNAFVPGLPLVTKILGALAKIPVRIMAALAALWPKHPPTP